MRQGCRYFWAWLSVWPGRLGKNDVDCLQDFPGQWRVVGVSMTQMEESTRMKTFELHQRLIRAAILTEFPLSAVKWFPYLVDRERPHQSEVDQTQRYSVPGDWNPLLAAVVPAVSRLASGFAAGHFNLVLLSLLLFCVLRDPALRR